MRAEALIMTKTLSALMGCLGGSRLKLYDFFYGDIIKDYSKVI